MSIAFLIVGAALFVGAAFTVSVGVGVCCLGLVLIAAGLDLAERE